MSTIRCLIDNSELAWHLGLLYARNETASRATTTGGRPGVGIVLCQQSPIGVDGELGPIKDPETSS